MGTRHKMAGHSFLGGWLICLLFTDKTESNARKRTQDTKYPSAPPPPPIELCPALIFLVFLHMFLSPAWFYMFFFILQNIGIVLLILELFLFYSRSAAIIIYIWITSRVKKSNPAGEPHCSPQGARQCSMAGVYLGSHEKNHVNSQCPPSTRSGAGNRHCTKPSLGIRVSIFFLVFYVAQVAIIPRDLAWVAMIPQKV
jgi:hypothetical protein